jgi:hypothetical protein
VFAAGARDDGQVHGVRQLRPDAVDVGFADVRVEDPLQHHVARARGVDRRRRVVVQGIAVQHGPVLQHGARVSEREPAVVDGGVARFVPAASGMPQRDV